MMKTAPWYAERIYDGLKRGPHKSSHRGIEFLREVYADMMDKEQWTVLPASLVKDIPGIRLSPLGLMPHWNKRDRMILDYSFFGVNGDTVQLAPPEALQFGQTLKRLLQCIHRANDVFGPVYMSKFDLSVGFNRLWLRPEDTLKLAGLFPSRPGKAPLVGIPLTNPMGWCSPPPNFSACTETVADLANAYLENPSEQVTARTTSHCLDTISKTAPLDIPQIMTAHIPSIPCTTPFKKPVRYWDIYYVD